MKRNFFYFFLSHCLVNINICTISLSLSLLLSILNIGSKVKFLMILVDVLKDQSILLRYVLAEVSGNCI